MVSLMFWANDNKIVPMPRQDYGNASNGMETVRFWANRNKITARPRQDYLKAGANDGEVTGVILGLGLRLRKRQNK